MSFIENSWGLIWKKGFLQTVEGLPWTKLLILWSFQILPMGTPRFWELWQGDRCAISLSHFRALSDNSVAIPCPWTWPWQMSSFLRHDDCSAPILGNCEGEVGGRWEASPRWMGTRTHSPGPNQCGFHMPFVQSPVIVWGRRYQDLSI